MLTGKIKHRIVRAIAVLLCLTAIMGFTASAKQADGIMQIASEGVDLLIYIKNLGAKGELTGQVAMNEAEIEKSELTEDIHTIVLLDNSLSITDTNKKKVQAILKEYFQRKPTGEQVSVAVFGEDIVYLAEHETDAEKLSEIISEIEYQNRDSYLTDVLYDEIGNMKSDSQYTRFIICTDGVDNKSIGYTKGELEKKLEEKNYPIYALGCVYKENTSELENFFALSRLTSAESFLVDDYEEYSEIVDELLTDIYCVRMSVPESCRDGSEKSILLTQKTSEGVNEFTGKAVMPFQIKEEPVVEKDPEPESTTEPETKSVVQSVEEPAETVTVEAEEEKQPDFITIGALILIIVAVIVLVVMQVLKKNQSKPKVPKPPKKEKTVPAPVQQMPQEEEADDDEGTVLIDQVRYLLVLKDINDPKKVFKYPMLGKVVIGKSANKGAQLILNYDNSVSGSHCAVSEKRGKFYVEDLNSLNGTFLNEKRVTAPVECTSGSKLKLGTLELIIEIIAE